MKTALAVIVLALACLLLANSSAQSIGSYQTLSGDSGRSILASLEAIDSQSKEQSQNTSENNTLWSWGSAPKGSVLVDGEVLTDPFNSWKDFNITESGIAQVGVDPSRGIRYMPTRSPGLGRRSTSTWILTPMSHSMWMAMPVLTSLLLQRAAVTHCHQC